MSGASSRPPQTLSPWRTAFDPGAAGALLTALHVARLAAPRLADLTHQRLAPTVPQYRVDLTVGTLCLFLTLGLVGAVAVAWPLLRRRVPQPGLDIAAVVLALALGFSASWPLGLATLAVIALVAPLLSDLAGEAPGQPDLAARSVAPAVVLLASELMALGWGAWNVTRPRDGLVAGGVVVVAVLVVIAVLRRSARSARLETALRLGVAFSPLLLGTLLGIAREPHPFWLAGGCAAGLWLALRLRGEPDVPNRVAVRLAYFAAPVSWVALAITPLAMRALPSANHVGHESFHAGWIEGALHGRFFQADVDTVYGLLREWMLTGYTLVAGMTLENLRVAAVLSNVLGAALLLAAAYPWLTRRPVLTMAFVYGMVLYTPLRCIVHYTAGISLGWADLSRSSLALFGMLGSLRAMTELRAGERLPLRALGWGCVLGAAVLYSQEFGITAIAATWLAYLVSRALEGGAWPGRVVILRTLAAHATGIAAVLLATLAIYAAFGKGRLLLETSLLMVRIMGAGEISFWDRIPVTAESFRDPIALFTRYTSREAPELGNYDAEYVLAPAVYVLGLAALGISAARRRWSPRMTMELALTAFGVVTYRITLSRADPYHVLSALPPALLLGISMADRYLRMEPRSFRVFRGGALALVALLFLLATERGVGMWRRLADLPAAGKKADVAPPVVLRRAGHIQVEPELVHLVYYIEDHTRSTDAIFARTPFPGMDGALIYFLANRRMPTRFAMTQELWNDTLRDEAYDDLVRDPPRLVIGADEEVIGPRIAGYLRDHYEHVWSAGNWPVFAQRKAPR